MSTTENNLMGVMVGKRKKESQYCTGELFRNNNNGMAAKRRKKH